MKLKRAIYLTASTFAFAAVAVGVGVACSQGGVDQDSDEPVGHTSEALTGASCANCVSGCYDQWCAPNKTCFTYNLNKCLNGAFHGPAGCGLCNGQCCASGSSCVGGSCSPSGSVCSY